MNSRQRGDIDGGKQPTSFFVARTDKKQAVVHERRCICIHRSNDRCWPLWLTSYQNLTCCLLDQDLSSDSLYECRDKVKVLYNYENGFLLAFQCYLFTTHRFHQLLLFH